MRAAFLFVFIIMDGDDMPAAITHYLQALQVWSRSDAVRQAGSKDAFLWGAQGPDFLYYHRLFHPLRKNLRALGTKLHHEQPSKLLSVMRDFLDEKGDYTTESYVCGFLCHYSLDRTAHPFVYWDVKSIREIYPSRSDGFLHNHVESVLDAIILRSITGELANDFDLRQTAPWNENVFQAVSQLYSYVLERLYGIHGKKEELVQSMKDCRKTCGRLNDKWMIKKPLAEALEKLTHRYLFSSVIRGLSEQDEFDYSNITHSKWKWPENQSAVRYESFFDLFHQSILDSIKFIDQYRTSDLVQMTKNIPFC